MQGDKVSLDLNLPLCNGVNLEESRAEEEGNGVLEYVTLDPAMPDTCFL